MAWVNERRIWRVAASLALCGSLAVTACQVSTSTFHTISAPPPVGVNGVALMWMRTSTGNTYYLGCCDGQLGGNSGAAVRIPRGAYFAIGYPDKGTVDPADSFPLSSSDSDVVRFLSLRSEVYYFRARMKGDAIIWSDGNACEHPNRRGLCWAVRVTVSS